VLKERLQRFGYYPPNITFDDKKYDDMLRDRMIWFQRNNGLAETGRADAPTVAALFGDGKPVVAKWYAKTDAEPQRALIIPVTKSAQWYLSAQDQFGMRIAVRNVSLKKTVSAFEISMYTEDAQGARLHDSGRMVKLCTLGPEEEMWSDYAYFDGVEGIHVLCAALHRVRYADGTYEIYEDAPYERWVLE